MAHRSHPVRPPFVSPLKGAALSLRALLAGLALAAPVMAQSAHAAELAQADAARQAYAIGAGALGTALSEFASQAGVTVQADSRLVEGLSTPGIRGNFTVREGFAAILKGTRLEAADDGAGVFSVRRQAVATGAAPERPAVAVSELPAIAVTGTAPDNGPLPAYAGGQVARGGGLGLLSNADFMDTPFSTASYTEQAMRDSQAKTIGDLLTVADPSVRDVVGRNNLYEALSIRGFRVMNDDVALNGLYGLLPKYRINTDWLERIELIKGPSALLSGAAPRGSTAANVNVLTKRADDAPLTRLTTEYMSDSRFGAHADIGRRFGDANQFGIRLNVARREGKSPIDRQQSHGTVASLGLDYRGSRLRLSSDLIYQDDYVRAAERGYFLAPGVSVPRPPAAGVNSSQAFEYNDVSHVAGMVRAEYDLAPRTTVYGAVGAARFKYRRFDITSGTRILDADSGAAFVPKLGLQDGDYDSQSAQAGLRTAFSTGPVGHALNLALDGMNQTQHQGKVDRAGFATNIYQPVLLDAPTAIVSSNDKRKLAGQTLSSIALADTLSFADGLVKATVGVRRQRIEADNYSAGSGALTSHYSRAATTPMAGLVLRATDSISVYANYIEGLAQGPTAIETAINAGQIFAPYKTKQEEVGIKYDMGRLALTLAAFQMKVPSGIVDPVTRQYGVNGEQRNRGLEFMAFGELTRGLRVLGGTTWLDGELTRTAGGVDDGNRAVGVPRLQANLGAEWDLPWLRGLALNGRLVHTGAMFLDTANTQRAPSWTRFDAGARYATRISGRAVTLSLNVFNVFGRRYWEANPTGYLMATAPRTVLLSVSADF